MSYDLAVFEPSLAPTDMNEFAQWFDEMTEWEEDHSYDDPKVSSPKIQAWFHEIREIFPALNGPFSATIKDDNPRVTDYSIGSTLIYGCFAWSEAESAYVAVKSIAEKNGVGFVDVSSEETSVWLPDASGKLQIVFKLSGSN